jgi:hypothetical protein
VAIGVLQRSRDRSRDRTDANRAPMPNRWSQDETQAMEKEMIERFSKSNCESIASTMATTDG